MPQGIEAYTNPSAFEGSGTACKTEVLCVPVDVVQGPVGPGVAIYTFMHHFPKHLLRGVCPDRRYDPVLSAQMPTA